jgi:hypothetical protein
MTDISRTNKEESRLNATQGVRADTDPAEPIVVEPAPTSGSEATRESAANKLDSTGPRNEESGAPLFSSKESSTMRSRWEDIQAGFVDEPRSSVQKADELVAEAIKHLSEGFADAREMLERQWDQGNDVSTEDLRLSFRRYRAFFERLLAI